MCKIGSPLLSFLSCSLCTLLQYSVYCKIFANREAAVKHVNILQRNVPQKGQIRILLVTEKQYAKIEIIVGGKSNQEQVVNSDAFIKL